MKFTTFLLGALAALAIASPIDVKDEPADSGAIKAPAVGDNKDAAPAAGDNKDAATGATQDVCRDCALVFQGCYGVSTSHMLYRYE
jgi:hypothetical protein